MAKTPAKKKKTGVANWKQQMQHEAEAAKGMEKGVGASNFFSTKNGKLSYNDQDLPNNEMPVIVVDYILENTYYTEEYDPNNPSSPDCYAFGRDEDTMAPHEEAPDPQAKLCVNCEWNKFGTADRGKGKACRNSRRLALTPAGAIEEGEIVVNDDSEYYETSDIGFLKIPPTSLKGWAAYVRDIYSRFKTPPMGVITHVKLVPDEADQFHIVFSHNGEITDGMGQILYQRQQMLRDAGDLEQPYQQIEDDEEEPAPRRKRPAKKKVAKKKPTKKRGARKY